MGTTSTTRIPTCQMKRCQTTRCRLLTKRQGAETTQCRCYKMQNRQSFDVLDVKPSKCRCYKVSTSQNVNIIKCRTVVTISKLFLSIAAARRHVGRQRR
jgi:hypothetical protein